MGDRGATAFCSRNMDDREAGFFNNIFFSVWCYRWSDIHGLVSEEILSGGVQEGTEGQFDEPVLQVRQPDADHVHVLSVPGCSALVHCRVDSDEDFWPETVDALWRRPVFRRSSNQWARPSCVDAYSRPYFARVRHWVCQSGINPSLSLSLSWIFVDLFSESCRKNIQNFMRSYMLI